MASYDWPGNIRELKNTLWRASILAEGRPISGAALNLPQQVDAGEPGQGGGDFSLESAERRAIDAALNETRGNRAKAAQLLGIARSTLHEKLRSRPTSR